MLEAAKAMVSTSRVRKKHGEGGWEGRKHTISLILTSEISSLPAFFLEMSPATVGIESEIADLNRDQAWTNGRFPHFRFVPHS